ncbi:trypsin-like peptidase domain-containing protein [Caenimonas koreensis]|nr:trypsin-like peptidase domain-containing protein [Caenimonas koreensis]
MTRPAQPAACAHPARSRAAAPVMLLVIALCSLLASPLARAADRADTAANLCTLDLDTPRRPRDFTAAAAAIAPAVVTIVVVRERSGETSAERAYSSGFVIDADGYIVGAAHAVRSAGQTWVVLADGRTFRARVAGLDRRSDVSLLKIETRGLPVVQAAPRPVCTGEWVASLGTPFGFDYSVNAGIVSAFPRYLPGSNGVGMIQTDVAMNPGSSGGPLFNARGHVVGMSSMVYSDTGMFLGVSFAVPVARVLQVVGELKQRGHVRTATIGAHLQGVSAGLATAFGLDRPRGGIVVDVLGDGPAARAGVRSGDIVLAINGVAAGSWADIEEGIAASAVGAELSLTIWRDRSERTIALRTAALPPDMPLQSSQPHTPLPRLGLSLDTARRAAMQAGLYVESVAGPALVAGVEPGDRIVAVNGIAVDDAAAFDAALSRVGNVPVVALLVARADALVYLPVTRSEP